MKINKQELLNVLEKVQPGLSSKDLIEFTNCFYFSSSRIITFNDEIYVSYPFSTNFKGTISSDKFKPFISKIKPDKDGFIDIQHTEKEIIIKSGKSKSGFSVNEKGQLPLDEITESFGKIKWKTIPDNFLDGIKLSAFCCSKNVETPILSCICIKADKIQSSDRLRCFTFGLSKKMDSFLLPSNVVNVLYKLPIEKYFVDDSWIHFITKDKLQISTRVYPNDDYPEIDTFFKGKGEKFIFPKNINAAIDKSIIFCGSGLDFDTRINVTINNKNLEIKSESETDWFCESIKCKSFSETISFAINPTFLKDILSKTDHCEIVSKKEMIKFSTDEWEHIISIIIEEE